MKFGTKTLGLAIASLFAVPAYAQSSNVEIYGRLNLGVDQYSATGAAAGSGADLKSRTRIYDDASRVGLRGSEDLGGGLRAIVQIETGVNVDTGSTNGQPGISNPNTGNWSSRDSWVGLEGDNFGRLTFGRQSIYWANGTIEQIGANYVNTSSPLASYNISGIVIGPAARESNTLQYSARMGGASATLSYAVPTASETAPAGTDAKDKIFGATLRYNDSQFDLQADWAKHSDVANVAGRNITGIKLGGAWKYTPGGQISLIYQNVKNENTFGLGAANLASPAQLAPFGVTPAMVANCAPSPLVTALLFTTGNGSTVNACAETKQSSWVLSWEQMFGNIQALAQYGAAGDVKTSGGNLADTKVQTMMVGGRYIVSKRTAIYLTYNQIRNGAGNYVDYWGGWMTSASQLGGSAPGLAASSSGADPRIIALGVIHNF